MQHRLQFLPREVSPEDGQFALTTDRDLIQKEIKRCRKEENAWPEVTLLWEQHPVLNWVNDKVVAAFGRHEAPVLSLSGCLRPNEAIFLVSGLIPNLKSHPLIHRWFGVRFVDGKFADTLEFAEVLKLTALHQKRYPNEKKDRDLVDLKNLLPAVVAKARERMSHCRAEYVERITPQLNEHTARLNELRNKRFDQLELRFADVQISPRQLSKKERERREIEKIFNDWETWVVDTMKTEDNPYIRIVAVLQRGEVMALNLTGISNENEFYTHHYLSAILENDLKELFAKWSAQEEQSATAGQPATWRPPYAKLGGLSKLYFVLRNHLEKTTQPAAIQQAQHEFFAALLDALGYHVRPTLKPLDEGAVPILGEIKKKSGAPDLWILETISPVEEASDPLELNFDACQYQGEGFPLVEEKDRLLDTPVSELITTHIFAQAEPPRWLLVLNFHSLVLIDRSKWNEKRFLRFDFAEILSRKEASTLKAMAALLHRDSLSPDDGSPLLDTLDENSHKHAFEVSEDLKYSVREAIELLGNEAVWFLRTQRKKGVFGESETAEKLDAAQLTRESLRYLYRLLFVLYIEARPELGYAPIRKSEQYAKGYSLESLRDLELVPLTTDESRNGYFIHESIRILFTLIFDGFNTKPATAEMYHTGVDAFSLVPLKSHLFDTARTPLLEKVRFRNSVLQQVIQLLSLSRPKSGQHRRGRISYAQLGINQLGAVYEGLLSYTGFFAETDLYEVKRPTRNTTSSKPPSS